VTPTGKVLLALLGSLDRAEREDARRAIRAALKEHHSTTRAAAALGISARTVQRILREQPQLRPAGLRQPGRPPTTNPTRNKKSQP
jgi:DNA invertase Pin-like site-specific DNA recombinase